MGPIVGRVMNTMKIYDKSKAKSLRSYRRVKSILAVKFADLPATSLSLGEGMIKEFGFLRGPSFMMTTGLSRCGVMWTKRLDAVSFVNLRGDYV